MVHGFIPVVKQALTDDIYDVASWFICTRHVCVITDQPIRKEQNVIMNWVILNIIRSTLAGPTWHTQWNLEQKLNHFSNSNESPDGSFGQPRCVGKKWRSHISQWVSRRISLDTFLQIVEFAKVTTNHMKEPEQMITTKHKLRHWEPTTMSLCTVNPEELIPSQNKKHYGNSSKHQMYNTALIFSLFMFGNFPANGMMTWGWTSPQRSVPKNLKPQFY